MQSGGYVYKEDINIEGNKGNSDHGSPMNLLIHHRDKVDSSHTTTNLRCLRLNICLNILKKNYIK